MDPYRDLYDRSERSGGNDVEQCPYCGIDEDEIEFVTLKQYDEHNHYIYECESCDSMFTAVGRHMEPPEGHETWTLQFIPELAEPRGTEDNEVVGIQAVKIIETDDDFQVKAERAKMNMQWDACEEVQAEAFAIDHLYEFIVKQTDIDADEEEFIAGEWMAHMVEE
jgi:hypothetical protein